MALAVVVSIAYSGHGDSSQPKYVPEIVVILEAIHLAGNLWVCRVVSSLKYPDRVCRYDGDCKYKEKQE